MVVAEAMFEVPAPQNITIFYGYQHAAATAVGEV